MSRPPQKFIDNVEVSLMDYLTTKFPDRMDDFYIVENNRSGGFVSFGIVDEVYYVSYESIYNTIAIEKGKFIMGKYYNIGNRMRMLDDTIFSDIGGITMATGCDSYIRTYNTNGIQKRTEKYLLRPDVLSSFEDELSNVSNESILEYVTDSIETVMSMGEVRDVGIDGDNVVIYTNDIIMDKFYFKEERFHDRRQEAERGSNNINAGQFTIRANFKNLGVSVDGRHPHIGSGGSICMGGFSREIQESLKKGDIVPLVVTIIELLSTYNDYSPYNPLGDYISSRGYKKIPGTTPTIVSRERPIT